MTDEHFAAVRQLREAADKLRLACIAVAGSASFLHLAFDQSADPSFSAEEKRLLGALRRHP